MVIHTEIQDLTETGGDDMVVRNLSALDGQRRSVLCHAVKEGKTSTVFLLEKNPSVIRNLTY